MTEPRSPSASLDDASLESLKRRHVAFVRAKITSDGARAEWRRNVEAGYDALLETPLRDLLRAELVDTLADELARGHFVKDWLGPLLLALGNEALERAGTDSQTLGTYVPEKAREAIDVLVRTQGRLPPRLLRRIFEHEALEEVMRDVLSDALLNFNERVNPFFADWGLPALLKRFLPLGLGGSASKILEALRTEFDRRLEPEMRRFIQAFSRQALAKAAEFVVLHQDEPKFLGVRRAVVAWTYEQPVRELLATANRETVEKGLEVGTLCTAHAARNDTARQKLREGVQALLDEYGRKTVSAWFSTLGVTGRPPFDAIVEATWPALKVALTSEPVDAWLTSLVTDFYDELKAETGSQETTP